ncbi:hypothetical protein [Chryseobacterium sp. R2A-55]|uniref:hypothetical protein n=1 Tax=Chryseobacterium sp. R2A-55 TaxID=2744445 RepID=UPI001F1EF72A|nr:hypothetical protein [Chryseobacterium sp. R2A-55]
MKLLYITNGITGAGRLERALSVKLSMLAVDFSLGDTKAIGLYSQNFDILPFTQGFVLRTLNYSLDAF